MWRCRCGGSLSLTPDATCGHAAAGFGIWRFRDSLPPVPPEAQISLGEGETPLAPLPGLPGDVYAKLEFAAPTGSFKDRGTAVMVSRLQAIGVSRVVEDSSGNAGASLAAYCAAGGIRCRVFAPAVTSPGKLTQIRAYGAEIVLVPGPRAAATEAAMAAAAAAYYANHAWDPYFFEGTKTAAFELVAGLGGRAPDRLIVPVGQGTLLLGIARGFRALRTAGRIPRLSQLIAVQSDACAPLYEMARDRLPVPPPVTPAARILAEGIATIVPLRPAAILEAVAETGGEVVRVPETEIPLALVRLGQAGLFVEPTSATVLPALDQLVRARGGPLPGSTILMLTGSGLKAAGTVSELLDRAPAPSAHAIGGH